MARKALALLALLLFAAAPGVAAGEIIDDAPQVEPLDHPEDEDHDSPGISAALVVLGLAGLALRRRG